MLNHQTAQVKTCLDQPELVHQRTAQLSHCGEWHTLAIINQWQTS